MKSLDQFLNESMSKNSYHVADIANMKDKSVKDLYDSLKKNGILTLTFKDSEGVEKEAEFWEEHTDIVYHIMPEDEEDSFDNTLNDFKEFLKGLK